MLSLTTVISGTDLSSRNAKDAMRDAQDDGLWFHRRKYMYHHFEPYARAKYGKAYYRSPGKYTRKSKTSRKRSEVRGKINRERRMMKSEDAGTLSPQERKRRPVYDSGRTREKILHGGEKITGRYDRRGMIYNPPFYITINPAGQLNKVKALTAIASSEERKMARILEKLFFRNLEKKTTVKKG